MALNPRADRKLSSPLAYLLERLTQILEQIYNVLEAQRKPDKLWGYTTLTLSRFGESAVGGGPGVNRQGSGIADVGRNAD